MQPGFFRAMCRPFSSLNAKQGGQSNLQQDVQFYVIPKVRNSGDCAPNGTKLLSYTLLGEGNDLYADEAREAGYYMQPLYLNICLSTEKAHQSTHTEGNDGRTILKIILIIQLNICMTSIDYLTVMILIEVYYNSILNSQKLSCQKSYSE